MLNPKFKIVWRSPILESKDRYCLVCGKKLKKKTGILVCSPIVAHFKESHDLYLFYDKILHHWGLVFPIETPQQYNYFKNELNELYQRVLNKIIDKKEVEDDE